MVNLTFGIVLLLFFLPYCWPAIEILLHLDMTLFGLLATKVHVYLTAARSIKLQSMVEMIVPTLHVNIQDHICNFMSKFFAWILFWHSPQKILACWQTWLPSLSLKYLSYKVLDEGFSHNGRVFCSNWRS